MTRTAPFTFKLDTRSGVPVYRQLIDQVQAGNISTVTITGNVITGNFKNSITWPQITPGPTPAGGAQAEKPQDYIEFSTIFPDSVGIGYIPHVARIQKVLFHFISIVPHNSSVIF